MTKKTGLAKRMRAWMKATQRPFNVRQLCEGLGVPPGMERDRVRNAMQDFLRRGEIIKVSDKRILRQPTRYRYVGLKLTRKAEKKEKIFRAMRLISFDESFAVSDIRLLTGCDRNYIDKLTKKLLNQGYIEFKGIRPRKYSYGKEKLYRVVDVNRFRIEVMK